MIDEDSAPAAPVLETRSIGVRGMTCDHCVKRVEKALRAQAGVTAVQVRRETARATVTFDRGRTGIGELEAAVRASGYEPVTLPE